MAFHCAIFYDVENLLKGYAFSQQLLNNLSLREILEAVNATGRISGIAVQRAYANWSDPRLAVLRGEITELGIDPVQVFGFARDPKKNAADIQLVVDAVDLAHVRPGIDVFVIVSGDGGFAALAKKLHEYGKTVICCAYPSSTNRVLRSVCDAFVEISDPEQTREAALPTPAATGKLVKMAVPEAGKPVKKPVKKAVPETGKPRPNEAPGAAPVKGQPPTAGAAGAAAEAAAAPQAAAEAAGTAGSVGHPLLQRLAVGLPRRTLAGREEMQAGAREVVRWLVSHEAGLVGRGLPLALLGEALRLVLADFSPERAGFTKLAECLQSVCSGTEVQVVRMPGGESLLVRRGQVPAGAVPLPDLDEGYLHSVEHYRSCLRSGLPIFRLPELGALSAVGAFLLEVKPGPLELGMLIEMVTAGCGGGELSSETVKRALLCMHSAGLFLKEPEGAPLAEQRLSLRAEISCPEELLTLVREAARAKLRLCLGQVDEAVFEAVPG